MRQAIALIPIKIYPIETRPSYWRKNMAQSIRDLNKTINQDWRPATYAKQRRKSWGNNPRNSIISNSSRKISNEGTSTEIARERFERNVAPRITSSIDAILSTLPPDEKEIVMRKVIKKHAEEYITRSHAISNMQVVEKKLLESGTKNALQLRQALLSSNIGPESSDSHLGESRFQTLFPVAKQTWLKLKKNSDDFHSRSSIPEQALTDHTLFAKSRRISDELLADMRRFWDVDKYPQHSTDPGTREKIYDPITKSENLVRHSAWDSPAQAWAAFISHVDFGGKAIARGDKFFPRNHSIFWQSPWPRPPHIKQYDGKETSNANKSLVPHH